MPKERERLWLEQYRQLEKFQEQMGFFPVLRYSDFATAPRCYAAALLNYCGCSIVKDSYAHVQPTAIGGYSASLLPEIRKWKFSREFKEHLRKYGYRIPQLPLSQRIETRLRMLKNVLKREIHL